jgi:hypothetical protein
MKEYEREMAALRKLNDDKLAKQQKALEAARIAEKNAATERDFIRQDLAEESERVRRLNRQKATEKKDVTSEVTTPKKKKTFSHRDGFDDDEIEILSPSKISPSKFQRRNVGSPSKPGKLWKALLVLWKSSKLMSQLWSQNKRVQFLMRLLLQVYRYKMNDSM